MTLTAVFFKTETFRLLVMLATISRQMLFTDKIELIDEHICGYEKSNQKNLFFKRACNKIIHATEYDIETFFAREDGEDNDDFSVLVTDDRSKVFVIYLNKFCETCVKLGKISKQKGG